MERSKVTRLIDASGTSVGLLGPEPRQSSKPSHIPSEEVPVRARGDKVHERASDRTVEKAAGENRRAGNGQPGNGSAGISTPPIKPAQPRGRSSMESRAENRMSSTTVVQGAEQDRLRSMTTASLLQRAVSEIKLLAKAEVLHARQELKDEFNNVRVASILLGVCLGISLCGLSVLFVALALALPISAPIAALIVGGALVLLAVLCGLMGFKRLPKKPMQETQRRLKDNLSMTRKQFA